MTNLFEPNAQPTVGYAQIALEQGIDRAPDGLTYAIPQSLAGLHIGQRVIVPLGRNDKSAVGYVIAVSDHTDVPRVKPIKSLDAHAVSLTHDLIELARWVSAYYCCPLGMVFGTMLPAAVKRGTGTVQQLHVSLADEQSDDIKLTKLQKAIIQTLRSHDERWVEIKCLADMAGARSITPLKKLIEKGVLTTQHQRSVRAQQIQITASTTPDITLNREQQRALNGIATSIQRGFSVHLLHGVTGSGKTEVYLRTIEHILKSVPDGGAIMLVPEIALTPQTVSRFVGRLPDVAVLHSGLTAAQRHEQWHRIRHGQSRIVVGARSAIFAPLRKPMLIIVDEEHEQSYKQDQLPRYHARDVAVKRGQLLGIPVVLGSATPSLESYHNAVTRGVYTLHDLPNRVADMKLPDVQIVDMIAQRRVRRPPPPQGGSSIHLLSKPLEDNLRITLRDKGQAMLLLNRRGYANYIACPDHHCGWMMTCKYCDATMVYHKDLTLPTGGLVRCHHCHAEQLLPSNCPSCRKKVTVFGLGTQRVEEEIARKFEGVRVARMDSDTMRTARDYHDSLEAFRLGRTDVLVGTQMIAKGLDFPNVRLVGVISADTALHMPDFRSSERTFQLIAQVAGRAGRGEHLGRVIVQSFSPDDPAIVLASKHDYITFATRELELRAAVGLPPATRMARIVVRHRDFEACQQHAGKLNNQLEQFNRQLGDAVRLRGPMPCPIARIADHHRWQIELIAPDAATLQRLLTAMRNAVDLHADTHTAIDVDPVAML